MTVTLLDPDGLVQVDAVRQVSVATGSKLVFVAGQVARISAGFTPDLLVEVEALAVLDGGTHP